MTTLQIQYTTIIIGCLYLYILIRNQKYRLLLPCIIHTSIWVIVCLLIVLTIKGVISIYLPSDPEWSYDKISPFILGLLLSSIVGFTIAHKQTSIPKESLKTISIDSINIFLKKYHWICYVCFFLGMLQIIYLINSVGWNGIGDYRIAAVSLKRTGYGAFAQQFSGHAAILGSFYLGILGCKHALSNVNIAVFLRDALLIATTNIAIGGRIWILTTLLPYIVGYLWQCNVCQKKIFTKGILKIILITILFLSVFSIFGTIRNETESKGIEKFTYLTDGSRMSNFVLTYFPEEEFDLEYGRAEFLYKWIGSPMISKFKDFINDDIALSVTVYSSIPPLYFDFGFWGGIIVWGIFCFYIEYYALKLKYTNNILGAIIFIELCKILFQAPVGQIFYMSIPIALWILLIYVFNKYIFKFN